MAKKLQLSLIMLAMVLLVVSCVPTPTVEAPEDVPTTGEVSVDEVATDISDVSNIDEELDTSELDGVDDILADIENI